MFNVLASFDSSWGDRSAYPEATPPDLMLPVSPSLALKAATEKDRCTEGDALASLTT